MDVFTSNFNLSDDNEFVFIDRTVCLHRYKGQFEEAIEYLEDKLDTCTKNTKINVYMFLLDVRLESRIDIDKIDNYIKNEKDKEIKSKLKDLVKQNEHIISQYV